MSLDHGGHLTHGSPVNFSGLHLPLRVSYGVTASDERIDMDEVREPRLARAPAEDDRAGATPTRASIDPEPFRAIADEVGACSCSTPPTSPV